MNNIVFLNLINSNSYSSKLLPGGLSTAEMIEKFCGALPDIGMIIPIAADPEQLKSFYGDGLPEKNLMLEDNRQDLLLQSMAELSEGFDHCFYFYGDTPLLDADLSDKIYAQHCRYYADYSFADGYPLGLAPEIIRSGTLRDLVKIVGEESAPPERDSLFSWIQKDINSFDIETEISPVDLRLKRISLSTDNRLNFMQLSSYMEDGFARASDFTSRGDELERHCRQLPAYCQIQITEGSFQSCSYYPYPQRLPGECGGSSHMDPEKLISLCRSLHEFSPDARVSISLWGEPSAHPQIMKILRAIKEIPLRYLIETSGVGWSDPSDPEVGELFCDPAMEWIVYLDALNPELYGKLRGKGYDEAYGFASRMLEINPSRTWVQAVRMKENEEDLEEFYRHWKDKTENVIIQKYDYFCGALPDRKVTDLSPLNRFPCWHLKRELCIALDGTAVLCQEDFRKSQSLGSCFDESPEEIWKRGRPRFDEHINDEYNELCAGCDEYYSFNF